MTEENIKEIASSVYKTACQTQDNHNIERLQRDFIKLEKQRTNLFDILKDGEDPLLKKSICEEITKIEKQKQELQNQIIIEKSNIFKITEQEIIDFLRGLRSGDNNSIRYKQMIVNVLVYKVYLYDDHFTIIYTIQNENGERVTKDIPLIEDMENTFKNQESSFLGNNDEPKHSFVELFEKLDTSKVRRTQKS